MADSQVVCVLHVEVESESQIRYRLFRGGLVSGLTRIAVINHVLGGEQSWGNDFLCVH